MLAIEHLVTKVSDSFDFPYETSARKFAAIVRGNEALDVVKVARTGCMVRVEHLGDMFDRGYFAGLCTGLGGEAS